MCLILFAYQQHSQYPFVLAANRDEFYARPTAPLHTWEDTPPILAGRDLQAGGTWLGLGQAGRFAALTNVRGIGPVLSNPPSRGQLTRDFLQSTLSAEHYLEQLSTKANHYQGFNLLLADDTGLWYFSNRSKQPPLRLTPGIYGLSNHLLDTAWPKIQRGKKALSALIEQHTDPSLNALLNLLQDRWQPPPETLPDTGIGLQREQLLAPIFISGDHYGTCCSTALLLHDNGYWEIAERSYTTSVTNRSLHRFHWPAKSLGVLSAAYQNDQQAGPAHGT